MNSEIIDINQKYFLASFRYNKNKPEDFGLKKVEGTKHYIDKNGDLWQNEILWDSGWGNEYGFMKLPELNFEQLWVLLTQSKIKANIKGAAELLRIYPEETKKKLKPIFASNEMISIDLSERLANLELLCYVMNHSEMKGKKPEEVDADYQDWKKLKEDFDRLKTINYKTNISFWQRIKRIFQIISNTN